MSETTKQRKILFVWIWAMATLFGGVAFATIDRTPTTTVGAVFKSSPGTSADGEYDSLHMSSDKRLLTNAAGAAADGAAVSGNPVLVAGQDGTNAQTIFTDTTGRQVVVGAAAAGAAEAGNPVLMGGTDGTNARSIRTDSGGRTVAVGSVADGSAVSTNPLAIGGSSSGASGGNAEFLRVTSGGGASVLPSFVEAESADIVLIAPTASNGTTAVQLVASAGSEVIYPLTLCFYNDSGVARTVTLQDSTGPTLLLKFRLGPDQSAIFDLRGDIRTGAGEALQFLLDGGTTGVTASGAAFQR